MTQSVHTRLSLGAVVLAGVGVRLLYILLFVNLHTEDYWEYGEIAKYLHAGKGYSLFSFSGGLPSAQFDADATPVPSAYMAPGYVWYLYPFLFLSDVPLRNFLILTLQVLLSAGLMVVVYGFTRRYFAEGAALTAAAITAFLPEFVYAVGSFTPTALYHIVVVVLLYVLYGIEDRPSANLTLIAGGLQAFLFYLRVESILLGFLLSIFWFVRGRRTRAVFFLIMLLACASPWVVRNYSVLEGFVPFTTSGGLNLYRGHNASGIGAWADSVVSAQVNALGPSPRYEIERQEVYLKRVAVFLREHPLAEPGLAARKMVALWLTEGNQPRAWHPLYLIPWIVMLVLSGWGVRVSGRLRTHMPTWMFLLYSTLLAVLFFVLPRYQTMMKIALVPFAAVGLGSFWNWIRSRAMR